MMLCRNDDAEVSANLNIVMKKEIDLWREMYIFKRWQ
jgi:hypothetical protein